MAGMGFLFILAGLLLSFPVWGNNEKTFIYWRIFSVSIIILGIFLIASEAWQFNKQKNLLDDVLSSKQCRIVEFETNNNNNKIRYRCGDVDIVRTIEDDVFNDRLKEHMHISD